MVLLIEGDKLFEEGVTLAIGASAMLDREQLQLRMQAAHLLHDGHVLRVEGLNLQRERVVIRAFALLELFMFICKVMLFGDGLDLLAHLQNLLMRELLEIEVILLLQLVLNARSIVVRAAHEVLIHDTVVSELQHEQSTCSQISFFGCGFQISLHLLNNFLF